MDIKADATSFGAGMRRRLIEDFAVAFYNGSIKPSLAEKNLNTGKDVEFLMDGPEFGKIPKDDMWSYSNAVGTGYQYRVVYKDKRFSDLERLLRMYSGKVTLGESDQAWVEQSLYDLILLMIKEKRLPQSFKIQPAKDPRIDVLVMEVEKLTRALSELEKRIVKVEEVSQSPVIDAPPLVSQTTALATLSEPS